MVLREKIENKEARVGIIGLGYVGLPLAVEFAKAGFSVTGIDIDEHRVEKLNSGTNYIGDVDNDQLSYLVNEGKLTGTTDYSTVSELDCVSICVPTPLSKLKDPDVSFIQSALKEIVNHFHADLLVVLESTTYPGTTRELILPALTETGGKIGQNLFLCFSPERIDPGNEEFNLKNTPKIIGGVTETCGLLGSLLYGYIADKVETVSSPETAEMVKLLENTFRSVNIGLVNETAIMCEKLGINVWEVIDAAATKPFGFMKFTPGPGLGGHCIPVDPHYLAWKMKTLDYRARFIELAGQINTAMPDHVCGLVRSGLNRAKKAVSGSRILLIGMAYKQDVNDIRESPSLDILKLLEEQGAIVDFHDPLVLSILWNGEKKCGVTLKDKQLAEYDAILILTEQQGVDYDSLLNSGTLIIDTRNVYNGINNKNLMRLGVSENV